MLEASVVEYVAAHLTTRQGCEVNSNTSSSLRTIGAGIATELIRLVADWFVEQGAAKVCVCVDADTPAAGPFYTARNAVPMRNFWVGWEDISVVPQ